MRTIVTIAVAVVVAFGVVACGGDEQPSARCEPVPAGLLELLGRQLDGDDLRLTAGQAVRSDNFENVWMVAGEIDGEGIEGPGDIGVWATNSLDPADVDAVFAVDGVANEFTTWTDGRETGPEFALTDHGVSESRSCL